MSPEIIFKLSTIVALAGWFILFFLSPFWFRADRFIIGVIILLLTLTYTWLVIVYFDFHLAEQMKTLNGFADIFNNKYLAAAGWVHYLALDLMTGTWIKKNAFKNGIPHWVTLICLLLTLMAGPIGLLAYLVTRALYTRQYFSENF
jgi:hypothetical protein